MSAELTDPTIRFDLPRVTKAATPRANFSEIGSSGLKRFSGLVYEEFLPVLSGSRGVRVYREMSDNDAIIGACLYAIEQVIRKVSWFVKAASDKQKDVDAAEFLKSNMTDMSMSWNDHISEVLTMLPYGWAFCELVYKIRRGEESGTAAAASAYDDGLVGWRKLPLRLQSTFFSWDFDDAGGVRAMQQQAPPDYKVVTIPIQKALLFRTKVVGNNPEGRSILRTSYRSWFIKKTIEEIEAIGVERDLVGLPVFTPPENFSIESPENQAVLEQVKKIISNLRRDEQEGICVPPGWEVELLQIGSSRRQFDVDRIINRYDKRIAAAVLAQFIMLGMDRVGSFALSDNQNDLFLVAVQGILDSIVEVHNRFSIPRLFRLNPSFAETVKNGKLPVLEAGKVTKADLAALGTYVGNLGKLGFLSPFDKDLVKELKRIGGFADRSEKALGEVVRDEQKEIPPSPVLTQPAAGIGTGSGEKRPKLAVDNTNVRGK